MSREKRLLQIHGEKNDKIDTVVRAVKYSTQRENRYNENVAFYINLEGLNTIKEIMKIIYEKLKLKHNIEKDLKTSEMIEWFRTQTN